MNETLRRRLRALAPARVVTAVSSARLRAHSHALAEQWGCRAVTQAVVERYGSTVQEGPFAGLRLPPSTWAEHLAPYLLGVYESELDEAWDTVFRADYRQIVDIGAKFGYYAVGLARRFPDARVVAFDTDWWARKVLREVSAVNKVTNVAVRGFCDRRWLGSHLADRALVISDCEGFEAELFDAPIERGLRTATLIIETHDDVRPRVTERLTAALSGTHSVRVVRSSPERRRSRLDLAFLSDAQREQANFEVRPPQHWLFCLPKS